MSAQTVARQYHWAVGRYREADKVTRGAQEAMLHLSRLYEKDRRMGFQERAAEQRGDEVGFNTIRRRRYEMAKQAKTLKIKVARGCRP